MKSGRNDKAIDPLFPRLHITDAEKGGPRAPPRNKMALCDEYNVIASSSKIVPVSLPPLLPLLPSSGSSSIPSQPSSSNVLGDKGKKLPTSSSMPGSSHSTESKFSHSRDGVTSRTVVIKSEPWSRGESNFKAPYFSQREKPLNYGMLPLPPGNERGKSFGLVPSGEHHNSFLTLSVGKGVDQIPEHWRNLAVENRKHLQDSESCSKKPGHISLMGIKNLSDTSLAGSKFSELGIRELKKVGMRDEQTTLGDRSVQLHQECKTPQKSSIFTDVKSGKPETVSRKRYASAIDDSSCSFPQHGDNNELPKLKLCKERLDDMHSETLPIGNADKKSTKVTRVYLELNPEDVVSLIGHRLFWRARKSMVLQQRIVSMQIFDLHRLIKVQKFIARSPEILHDSQFHPDLFPPINKLIFVNPLDPMPANPKTKEDVMKSDTDKDCEEEALSSILPTPAGNTEKGRVQQLPPKPLLPMLPSIPADAKIGPLPIPVSIPTDAKLAPWCFHPPPGTQWLVPVRSPSGGFTYKSYTGPFPTGGFVSPVNGGMAYAVPLGHNYLQPCGLPALNASASNLEGEKVTSSSRFQLPEVDKNSSTGNANNGFPFETSHKILSEQNTEASDQERRNEREGEGNGPVSLSDRTEGETLSLFPTTPSSHVSNDQSKVQVIKVVPHSRNSAAESAARIFQSIQEERKRA